MSRTDKFNIARVILAILGWITLEWSLSTPETNYIVNIIGFLLLEPITAYCIRIQIREFKEYKELEKNK